jgi:hypothetical protein
MKMLYLSLLHDIFDFCVFALKIGISLDHVCIPALVLVVASSDEKKTRNS